jgi:4-amino-4-deoxy-L-arabinose transferase-like glycosyltransferase
MSATTLKPAPEPTATAPARRARLAWAAGVFAVACAVFGLSLGDEPHFVDESAYVAQSYYADLFLEGRRDDPAWLEYPAFDLPPLAKYLVGLSWRVAGYPRPGPMAASAWYDDTSRRFESPASLVAARVPMVILGGLGCVAIYAIGTLAYGRISGLVAAGLLMVSPLYYLHARRAMSDIPAESCGLVALAIGLLAWSRWMSGKGGWRAFAGMAAAGVFVGLAVLAKLNGSIAGMILGAWAVLGLIAGRTAWPAKLGLVLSTVASGAVAFATFAALNPFLTAHPAGPLSPGVAAMAAKSIGERVRVARDHRVDVSAVGQRKFADDALTTVPAKLAAVAVQGFGRFSPLGPRHSLSTRRFDWRQDWGALLWLPMVLAGAVASFVRGRAQRRRGEPPTSWAVLLGFAVALGAVASFIPLAWDRYYLPIQPGAVLLASSALAVPIARMRVRPRREGLD